MITMKTSAFRAACIAALALGACTSHSPTTADPPGAPDMPKCELHQKCGSPSPQAGSGSVVSLKLAASDQAQLTTLQDELRPLQEVTAASLLNARKLPFESALGYDPKTAKNLELIQATPLALSPAELDKLGEQGFAISTRTKFPNMAYGLKAIYAHDLPLYISIDPILDAVHIAYDEILKGIESMVLLPDLDAVLEGARTRNASQTSDAEVRKDLDFYFTAALALLRGRTVEPLGGADAKQITAILQKAENASGIEKVSLFGVQRDYDFSQFAPRGHYADSEQLTLYFRAMMWLGRTDFRLIETQPDGTRLFHRRQFNSALALRDAVSGVMEQFQRIDAVVSAFVGEHDYMELHEIDRLLEALGVKSSAEVAALTDQQIAQTIIERGFGAQRIMSQVIFKDPSTFAVTLPLDRSFAFLGQRYAVDSHVFSDLTYDRVLPGAGEEPRYLPDPLDAAYAALGNSAALPLLREDLELHGHAAQLERSRKLIDGHGAEFWQKNLYNLWLSSLRALSPTSQWSELPTVARSERWSRRVLNTQLSSWAQLRHDTILYVKQSYTSGAACEYPDAYVDPYPEAFGRLAQFAQKGTEVTALLPKTGPASYLGTQIGAYFSELASVSNILRDMAEQQRQGVPFNAAQMAFVNDAVKTQLGCGGPPSYTGWYAKLMYLKDDSEMDPTIADVHTDPGGTRPPKVLHVATGLPRFMVLTVNTCNGPRAYAGLSFAYHEVVTDDLKRLNDIEWEKMAPAAADVPWLAPVLAAP